MLLVALLVVAWVAPRAVALRGVAHGYHFRFMDMVYHLSNLDELDKLARLPAAARQDPFFHHFGGELDRFHAEQWPTTVYQVARLFLPLGGPDSVWVPLGVNALFTLVLVVGVLLLGHALGGLRLGLWGALLTLLCPALVAHSWYFSLDYPLTAMVVVGLALLVRTRGLSRPLATLGFAVWSGLGLAVKLSYALYLVVPGVVTFALAMRSGPRGQRLKVLYASALVVGGALLISVTLQRWDPSATARLLWLHLSAPAWEPGDTQFTLIPPLTLRWLAAMGLFALSNFPWPLLLLALPGLVLLHRRQSAIPGRWVPLTFIYATYAILTIMANKMERYLQPVYPVLCLLAAWWVLAWVRPRRLQRVVLGAEVAVFAGLLVVTHFWPTPWILDERMATRERYMLELDMPGHERLRGLARHGHHPFCGLRPVARAARALMKDRAPNRPVSMGVIWPREFERALPRVLTSYDLFLLGLDLFRQRFVFFHDGLPDTPLEPQDLYAPNLLLLHPPGLDLTAGHPMLRRVGARDFTIACDDPGPPRQAVRLTLFEARWQPGERNPAQDPDARQSRR